MGCRRGWRGRGSLRCPAGRRRRACRDIRRTIELQRDQLEAASRRPRDRGELARRMRDGLLRAHPFRRLSPTAGISSPGRRTRRAAGRLGHRADARRLPGDARPGAGMRALRRVSRRLRPFGTPPLRRKADAGGDLDHMEVAGAPRPSAPLEGLRCGCSENARQMRCTVEIDTPVALAIERVASRRQASSPALSSPPRRSSRRRSCAEPPRRGSSTRPSRRPAANCPRHAATVTRVFPSRSAIARLVMPSAASSTISTRIASARAIFRRRARAAVRESQHRPLSETGH